MRCLLDYLTEIPTDPIPEFAFRQILFVLLFQTACIFHKGAKG
jgi:hypothetical protein